MINQFCDSLLNTSIQGLSDHGASKEPKNPLSDWILRFLFDAPYHDPKDLGLICFVKKRKTTFQSWIFLKKSTPNVKSTVTKKVPLLEKYCWNESDDKILPLLKRAKKCTKIYNAHAEPLFCSLNLLLSDASVAVAVVVFLNSLI